MNLPLFHPSDLMPFAHWALIMASYYLSKMFIKQAFIENNKHVSTSKKVLYTIYILVPSAFFSAIISLFVNDNFINWGVWISVILPSLIGCYIGANAEDKPSTYTGTINSGGRY